MYRGYFVTCQPLEAPDGPAKLIGPYQTREEAWFDIWWATVKRRPGRDHLNNGCQHKHFVGFGQTEVRSDSGLEIAYCYKEEYEYFLDKVLGQGDYDPWIAH